MLILFGDCVCLSAVSQNLARDMCMVCVFLTYNKSVCSGQSHHVTLVNLSVFVFWNSKQASFLSVYCPSVNCLVLNVLGCQACCAFSVMSSSSLSGSTCVKSLLVNFWVWHYDSYFLQIQVQFPAHIHWIVDLSFHSLLKCLDVMDRLGAELSAHHSCWKLWSHTWKYYDLNYLVIVSLSRSVSSSLHISLLHHSQPAWK